MQNAQKKGVVLKNRYSVLCRITLEYEHKMSEAFFKPPFAFLVTKN